MKTYGISPFKFWRLFEHEGYQVLVHVSEDDDTGDINLVMEGCIPEISDIVTQSVKIGDGTEETARKIFEGFVDSTPEQAVNGFLESIGPAIEAMLVGQLPEGYEVSQAKYDNGVLTDGQGGVTRGPYMFDNSHDDPDRGAIGSRVFDRVDRDEG